MQLIRNTICILGISWCFIGCDSTVAIDPTLPNIDKVKVFGACPTPDSVDLDKIRVSVSLEQKGNKLAGPEFLFRESKLFLGDVFTADRVQFSSPPSIQVEGMPAEDTYNAAAAQSDMIYQPLNLRPYNVEFVAPGYVGDPNADAAVDAKNKLIVLAVDSSRSFIGVNPADTSDVRQETASDGNNSRIGLLEKLVTSFTARGFEGDYFSVVKMDSGSANNIVGCSDGCSTDEGVVTRRLCSNPVRDRESTECSLTAVTNESTGNTPMNAVLSEIYRNIIANQNVSGDLNPVVVLFTDGAEENDESIDALLEEGGALDLYANGYQNNFLQAPVPIIVLHLDQRPEAELEWGYRRGRDARLMQLACATGGEYLYFSNNEELTDGQKYGDLGAFIRNRIKGHWAVDVNANFGELGAGDWSVATSVRVELPGSTISQELSRRQSDVNNNAAVDRRLWFSKE